MVVLAIVAELLGLLGKHTSTGLTIFILLLLGRGVSVMCWCLCWWGVNVAAIGVRHGCWVRTARRYS
jgi:hypothetical protein